jgi:hypothetical protein
MIDTIAITLPEKDFRILKPERFNPNAGAIFNPVFGDGGLIKAVYNPTKPEKSKGYRPRLTLFKRPYTERSRSIWLKIEFSAPKLIFGNNFEELRGSAGDLEKVIDSLLTALEHMGIETTHECLLNARVSAIHYSKNILLERSTPCYLLIQTLEKLDLSGKLDLTQTDFRNSGQMVKYHSSLYEIALYDKVKDLEQAVKCGEKRGIETDYGEMHDLFSNQLKPEVLRFEVRLTSRKIKGLFRTLGFKQGCILKELFDGNLSRAVLLHYWQVITDGLYVMNIDVNNIERLLHLAYKAFPHKRSGKIMELIGFIMISQKLGMRGARLALGLKNHQWYRLKADIKILEKYTSCPRFAVLADIKQQLREFIPLARNDLAVINTTAKSY